MTIWKPWHECPENEIEGKVQQQRWANINATKRACPACKKVFVFDESKQDWIEESKSAPKPAPKPVTTVAKK